MEQHALKTHQKNIKNYDSVVNPRIISVYENQLSNISKVLSQPSLQK